MCVSKVQDITGRKPGCNRYRPVLFGFLIFRQMLQLATKKFQNLCNCNGWSGLLQLGSVRFRSFFPVQPTGPVNTTPRELNDLCSSVIAIPATAAN